MNTSEQTTNVKTPETSEQSAATVTEIKKPTRREFYVDVVLNAKGEVIEESTWKSVVGDATGRTRAGMLRRSGMQLVHVFKKNDYEEAKRKFADQARKARVTERDQLIISAFQRAEVPNDPHIERALRDLLPVFANTPVAKTSTILRNVVKTVASGIAKPAE